MLAVNTGIKRLSGASWSHSLAAKPRWCPRCDAPPGLLAEKLDSAQLHMQSYIQSCFVYRRMHERTWNRQS